MAEFIERIGERIRQAREEQGLTQPDLARALTGKVDAQQISRWERGLHKPRNDTLEEIAKVLHRPIAFFLADQPDKSVTPDPFRSPMNGNGEEQIVALQRQIELIAGEIRAHHERAEKGTTERSLELISIRERLANIENNQRALLKSQEEILRLGEVVRELLLGMRETAEALAVARAEAEIERATRESVQHPGETHGQTSTK